MKLDSVVAIDMHVHVEVGPDGGDHLSPELRQAASRYFKREEGLPTIGAIADRYRALEMAAVVFTVDSELTTGQPRIPNAHIVAGASANADVLIPFASIDPRRGVDAVAEARELVADGAVRGFKFHPNIQQFFPNDRIAYDLYAVIEEAGLIALFHTGHSGIGTGVPGGGGIRLKYSNPMAIDDVAVDFPELSIVMAHPSFPWQDEALAVAMHKPSVWIDLSGWTPKRFPESLKAAIPRILRSKVLFGSDFPLITPERWIDDFDALGFDEDVRTAVLVENARSLLGM